MTAERTVSNTVRHAIIINYDDDDADADADADNNRRSLFYVFFNCLK